MRVLVVEDDPVTREIVAAMVARLGHDVSSVADGETAWDVFQESSSFDVVLSDWKLPGIDGLELCRRIRTHAKETYTYFLLSTVAGGRGNRILALEEGADDFLTKPLDPAELEIRLILAARITRLRGEVRAASERLTLLEEQTRTRRGFEGMVGKSVSMHEVFRRLRLAAQSNVSVFVHGESGT
ncbi:MAG: response regulator, partial [Planctomycetes bacterium]|nr:response regulator [Planctomycetota bacterium]